MLTERDGKKSGNIFDRFDIFGTKLPGFNFENNPKVGSSIGGIFSIVMIVLVLGYATAKGRVCFQRSELKISNMIHIEAREHHDQVDLSDFKF